MKRKKSSTIKEEPYHGIQEVARWPEPTRVLVLTDRSGIRRFRVEMLDSDVTHEALNILGGLLDQAEATNPIEPGNGNSQPVLKLVRPGVSE